MTSLRRYWYGVKKMTAGTELVALSQDSILLFSKDHRRKRSYRAFPNRAQQVRASAPERA